ncbi:hypothetical protein C8R45DRAFT_932874 [Mycena sanguinolenta]|nr:hypothetical protein C8R45DRAFT_932874 [Mycena sanguinolenta]
MARKTYNNVRSRTSVRLSMPRKRTVTDIWLENLAACLAPAVAVLTELNDTFAPPFVQPISRSVASLIKLLQNVKQNKKECAQLLESTHQVLYAIISLHIRSEVVGSLSPAMIDHVGNFMRTLHKIYTYVEAQQDNNKIKQLFRSIEMNSLVKQCYAELDEAKKIFGVHMSLEELNDSSNSFSLLPAKPKIFHGRDTELQNILRVLDQQAPHIAILGGGGMGKTSLARAALHHPDSLTRFEQRFFVSAEPATTSVELAALIGLHVGLDPGQDLTKAVVQYFSKRSSCLLILDNLETAWEPTQSRAGVEEFLSLLTDIDQLGLIITMRGAERPAKVQWTHPFLLPLQPLSDDAAQQTFMDIADNSYSVVDLNQLLSFTDNVPLAVDLLAHLVDYEGLENVLTRWQAEKTTMLSVGHDRRSNLDASINLSLSSPRITSDDKQLLSLLSILPNGLSDADLVQSKLPIPNILTCKVALLATSLAYQNSNKRLMALVPVREHIQQFLPPSPILVHSLRKHFYTLLELYNKHNDENLYPVVSQITANLGNLQEVLHRGLECTEPNFADTVSYTLFLSSFYRLTGRGPVALMPLMDQIKSIFHKTSDPLLEIQFITEVLRSHQNDKSLWIEQLIVQAISHFEHINDPILESKFYYAAGVFMFHVNFENAWQLIDKAWELSKTSGDRNLQCLILLYIASLKIFNGEYSLGQEYAREAQQLSELSMDLYHSAAALHLRAACSIYLGNYHRSLDQLYRARKIFKICGMSGGILDLSCAVFTAEIHCLKSEYVQAQRIVSDIGEITSPHQNPEAYAGALQIIAYIQIQIDGDAAHVWKNLAIATDIYNSTNSRTDIVLCEVIGAGMNLREHKFHLAQRKLKKCLHFTPAMIKPTSLSLEHLANIEVWPTSEWQSRWPVIYLSFAYRFKEKLALYKALLFLGDVFLSNEDEVTASTLYTVALEGFTYMDVHRSQAECMRRLGDLANEHENTVAALVYWKAAQSLFEKSSQAKDIANIDSKISAATNKAHEEAS